MFALPMASDAEDIYTSQVGQTVAGSATAMTD
jgi:hypothetical protein